MTSQPGSPEAPRLPARAVILCAGLLLGACSGGSDTKQPAPGSDEQLMQKGLAQMYQNADPIGAQATFREVLLKNPTHYGAHYQLAAALDRGGKPAEARAAWEVMQTLAQAIQDTATLGTVRRRLAAPDTASQDAMMTLGLDFMYKQSNLPAAADQFRQVLAKNPAHYGATYQLATTLDRLGQRAQATPLWVKVLGMATQYKDERSAQVARTRLQ